ncbi:NUDIX domain-containing protein [Dehalogenimonas formicexedens]|uniref:NUDIX domain-containing protein n=1 Tax=Dehalogenimonas formicexedens TaxID=1839801 RepID=A0A1P8F899_9CHLR|nr:NUDIX hydrolase [Dehalogenimonas formicexedens]APV44675.1 NUDIX domain-containing protein [Dehalogenimonas formicexedens]
MSDVKRRRRGTVIIETSRGILLTKTQKDQPFILPGGGAKRDETRFIAALRELSEETHLSPYSAHIIFNHKGKIRPTRSGKHLFQDHHTVCLVKATGNPRPGGGDARYLGYYTGPGSVWISMTTAEIIDKYLAWKQFSAAEKRKTIREELEENLEDVDETDVDDNDG